MLQKGTAKIALRTATFIFISITFCAGVSAFPSAVAAEVVSVQTRELLQGSSSCAPLSAYDFTPYIYDGALHSFEFTIPDSSYVALSGTAGDTSIPFQFMTRRGGSSSSLRVHVDIQTAPIPGRLPLSVTLLSAKGGGPVCMSTVVMAASSSSQTTLPPVAPTVPAQTPTQTTNTPSGSSISDTGNIPQKNRTLATTSSSTAESSSTSTAVSFLTSIQNKIVESCAPMGSALRLWMILLAMYLAVVAVAVLAQTPALRTYSIGQRTATILTPLILLLAFWYFTESCRATPWVPLAAILIAAVGLLALYRDDSHVTLYLERMKSTMKKPEQSTSAKNPSDKPMITPPPTKTPGA